VPPLYSKLLTDELDLSYNQNNLEIKEKLAENIKLNRIFFIILDIWTGINQKVFLGIIILVLFIIIFIY
jgi:hypothetical protein